MNSTINWKSLWLFVIIFCYCLLEGYGNIIKHDDKGSKRRLQEELQQSQQPSSDTCADMANWYDSSGPDYGCEWYSLLSHRCSSFGDQYKNFGKTANEACCACGGGIEPKATSDLTLTTTPPTSISTLSSIVLLRPNASLTGSPTTAPKFTAPTQSLPSDSLTIVILEPSAAPEPPTAKPSLNLTLEPAFSPSISPMGPPPINAPTASPTTSPTWASPTPSPTTVPTASPIPTSIPTTKFPTVIPGDTTSAPTTLPPSSEPTTVTSTPTLALTANPTMSPTLMIPTLTTLPNTSPLSHSSIHPSRVLTTTSPIHTSTMASTSRPTPGPTPPPPTAAFPMIASTLGPTLSPTSPPKVKIKTKAPHTPLPIMQITFDPTSKTSNDPTARPVMPQTSSPSIVPTGTPTVLSTTLLPSMSPTFPPKMKIKTKPPTTSLSITEQSNQPTIDPTSKTPNDPTTPSILTLTSTLSPTPTPTPTTSTKPTYQNGSALSGFDMVINFESPTATPSLSPISTGTPTTSFKPTYRKESLTDWDTSLDSDASYSSSMPTGKKDSTHIPARNPTYNSSLSPTFPSLAQPNAATGVNADPSLNGQPEDRVKVLSVTQIVGAIVVTICLLLLGIFVGFNFKSKHDQNDDTSFCTPILKGLSNESYSLNMQEFGISIQEASSDHWNSERDRENILSLEQLADIMKEGDGKSCCK